MTSFHDTQGKDKENQEKDEFLDKLTVMMDAASDEIDGATKTRLQAIRREALTVAEKPYQSAWWVPAGSLTAVATLAVVAISLWTISPNEGVFTPPLEDIALLSDGEELEFYQDMDFYLWLDSKQLIKDQTSNEQKTG